VEALFGVLRVGVAEVVSVPLLQLFHVEQLGAGLEVAVVRLPEE
jgi:hypothetical protein